MAVEHLPDPEWDFADRLRKARRRSGLTQEQMAQSLGVRTSRYSSWESGGAEPRGLVMIAQQISTLTRTRVEWLLGLDARNASLLDSLEAAEAIAPVQEPLPGLLAASSYAA